MLASIKWLKELCQTDADLDLISKRLTEGGLEVEGVEDFGELPGVVITVEPVTRRVRPEDRDVTVPSMISGNVGLPSVEN